MTVYHIAERRAARAVLALLIALGLALPAGGCLGIWRRTPEAKPVPEVKSSHSAIMHEGTPPPHSRRKFHSLAISMRQCVTPMRSCF